MERGSTSALVRRCAWCSRVWTGHSWEAREVRVDPDAETNTICPDCVEQLRAVNLSR